MSVLKKVQRLNELYADCFTEEQAFEELIYLTSKNRSHRTTKSHLKKVIANREVGYLLRRLDPVSFMLATQTYSNR